eukprot:213741_1
MHLSLCIIYGITMVIAHNVGKPEQNEGKTNGEWKTEIINGHQHKYLVVDGLKTYEGDMIIPKDEGNRRRLNPVLIYNNYYWPNGYIPYEIDGADEAIVNAAIAHWNTKTNIKLGKRLSEPDFVRFIKGAGCWSYVGKVSRGGVQEISIGRGCDIGSAIHEIGHSLGMLHTQSREDRDSYININWDNIESNMGGNFGQQNSMANDCLRYDYGSIMHYSQFAFSKNGKSTIITTNPKGSFIGQRNKLSIVDVGCVNSFYSRCKVALFQNDNFSGKEYSPFGSDHYGLNELEDLEFDNDEVSSMRVIADENTKCTVILYEKGKKINKGWSATVIADNSKSKSIKTFSYTLSQLETYGFIDNDMSALSIIAESSCTVTFYKHGDYSGDEYGPYVTGEYTINHLLLKNFVNDEVSSMKIEALGYAKCTVELYGNGDYSGLM